MNVYIVCGFILTAAGPLIGGLLIHHGNGLQARSDLDAQSNKLSKEANERIQPILRDLQTLKGMPPSELSFDAVAKVENDVKSWADEFVENGYVLQKAYESTSKERREKADAEKSKILDYFNFFIATLRVAIDAYNKIEGIDITYQLPDASIDILTNNTNHYRGIVSFNSKIQWKLGGIQSGGGGNVSPYIINMDSNVDSTRPKGDEGKSQMHINFAEAATKFRITKHGDFQAAFPKSDAFFPAEQFESEVREFIKKSLEWQILSMDDNG